MTAKAHRTAAHGTAAHALRGAARSLIPHSESPRLDAELLLAKVLGTSRAGLIARADETLELNIQFAYAELIGRRQHGAPVAYLTGIREFWSLPLHVTPDVLVPRPETEVLVELALGLLPEEQPASILDLGTGSGAIALAIASARPRSRVTAVDVSAPALGVATRNARELGLTQIDWRLGSWFDAVPGEQFDMIVANPPYIAAADPALANLSAEPAIALIAGITGLEALAAITAAAGSHLRDHGWLILEHGCDQAAAVAGFLSHHGFTKVRSHYDYSGRLRVTLGSVHPPHEEQT